MKKKVLPSGLTEQELRNLRSLVRKYNDLQQARFAFENRIRALKDKTTPMGTLGFVFEEELIKGKLSKKLHMEKIVQRGKKKKVLGLRYYESALVKEMGPLVESNRLWVEWLSRVKGIGIKLAAEMIVYFEPYWAELEIVMRRKKQEKGVKLDKEEVVTQKLYPPKSRSSLIKLCGYAVNEDTGRAVSRVYGQGSTESAPMGNQKFKTFWFRVFESVLKQKGKLYELWKQYHEEIKQNYPDWLEKWYKGKTREEAKKLHPKTYIPNTLDLSRRRFIKTLVSIVWEKYQEIYGLPIPPPMHAPNQPLTKDEWIHPEDLFDM